MWLTASSSASCHWSARAFSPISADDLVEALCGLFAYLTGPNRVQTTARLVLFLEGSHDAGLREALTRGRAAMEATAVTAFAELGARDPRAAGAAIAAMLRRAAPP